MKNIKFLYLIIFLVEITTAFAQSPILDDVAHRRYWFYRTRMINDFMKVGTEQGDCIVFPERNQGATDHTAKVGPDQIDITNQYLLTLALEYKFLSASNESTRETLKEIYSLIYTINRLDEEADQFWATNHPTNDIIQPNPNDRNGFMLREDMPRNYFNKTQNSTNYLHFNYGARIDPNNPKSFTGLEEITTLDDDNKFSNFLGFNPLPLYAYDFCDPGDAVLDDFCHDTYCKSRCSLTLPHDKYYSMFLAFMFLIKYIPDNVGYTDEFNVQHTFQDGVYDIKTEVRNITNRCHTYLRGNTFGSQLSNWVMEYPDETNLYHLGKVLWYSYPLATMICKINDDYPWNVSCLNKQDGISSTTGFMWYDLLNANPIPAQTPTLESEDGSVFIGYCQAGSNSNSGLFAGPLWQSMHDNALMNGTEWSELMRKVLHQTGGLASDFPLFAMPLSVAPCAGPYNFGDGNNGGYEWSSQDRNEHPSKRGTNSPFAGNYPGVDYMLLHNLYYEYLCQEDISGEYNAAHNLMDQIDEMNWPFNLQYHWKVIDPNMPLDPNQGNVNIGTTSIPIPLKVFQNIRSTAKIYATASPWAPNNTIPSEIEYRAGKEIALLPGFSVEQGSSFSARVERYLCSDADYDYGTNGMRPGTDSPPSNYETDIMNTTIPTHYVKGSKSNAQLYPGGSQENVFSTKTNLNENKIEISPNPNNGNFTISTNQKEGSLTSIEIINTLGNTIQKIPKSNSSTIEINIKDQPSGLYIVKITSEGKTIIKKIIKN